MGLKKRWFIGVAIISAKDGDDGGSHYTMCIYDIRKKELIICDTFENLAKRTIEKTGSDPEAIYYLTTFITPPKAPAGVEDFSDTQKSHFLSYLESVIREPLELQKRAARDKETLANLPSSR